MLNVLHGNSCQKALSYLEGEDGEGGEEEGGNPKAEDYLGLVVQLGAALEPDGAGGVVLQHLLHAGAEMVVERGALPNADMLAAALGELIDLRLQDDGYALHEEYSAEDGEQ